MKKILIAIAILIGTFLVGSIIAGAYSWSHIIGGGLYSTTDPPTGVALKVDADGILYLTD